MFFSLGLKQLDEEQQRSRRKSSPVSSLLYKQQQPLQQQDSIPLSEIIAPLQNGGFGSIEDIIGKTREARVVVQK